ncbi:tRNA/tmRNA/rRNA uracil-C5-methylase (TrmA/RlmC/RlmD family) [Aurantimicrobium minutum]|uniref:class I SAM-dependent RNA methyltransferase n=1 Tax=Aurantimicrobium minutum TaxID=708131 RepID=UPI0024066EBB|nr:TRAM domain-containing protein [Aurantimicrobium minutum]MDF9810390.1 tRNA/tmRNA/rRNA uracil-C5-methylase (TrmA/RlmC/RlmD family) [Aurantimicrobium minutum]
MAQSKTQRNVSTSRGSEFVGTVCELDITNVAHGGVFVARHEGRVIFVADTLPGERVLARITDASQKSFWRADTVEVLKASADRQEHVWSAASVTRDPAQRAGGAEFGHIKLATQRDLKAFVLEDSLSRMGKIERRVEVEALEGDDESQGTGWRTRVRLHVNADGKVGPYAARSHNIIEVEDLPLAASRIAELAPFGQRIPGIDFIDLVGPSGDSARAIAGNIDTGKNKKRPAPEPITETVSKRAFKVDVRGFWQVHRQAAATLSEAVSSVIDEALFDPRAANHDLYGGVGLFAAAVGDRFGSTTRMTSVESDEMATEYALDNLAEWVGARAVTARVDRYLDSVRRDLNAVEKARYAAATIVLDPPRAGAGKDVVNSLAELSPAQLVYVACDPVALARDVALFAERGYQLEELRAFDLFPNTHHVEAVARFVKN